jgi:hypothetical protein
MDKNIEIRINDHLLTPEQVETIRIAVGTYHGTLIIDRIGDESPDFDKYIEHTNAILTYLGGAADTF